LRPPDARRAVTLPLWRPRTMRSSWCCARLRGHPPPSLRGRDDEQVPTAGALDQGASIPPAAGWDEARRRWRGSSVRSRTCSPRARSLLAPAVPVGASRIADADLRPAVARDPPTCGPVHAHLQRHRTTYDRDAGRLHGGWSRGTR
jgi:hypothetical protein